MSWRMKIVAVSFIFWMIPPRSCAGDTDSALLLLLADRDANVRTAAAFSLIESHRKSAEPMLLALLRDPSPEGRHWVTWILAKMGNTAGVPQLLADLDSAQKLSAIHIIGLIGDHSSGKENTRMLFDSGVQKIIQLLADKDLRVRAEAARALGRVHETSAVNAVTQALQNEPNAEVRSVMCFTLGLLDDPTSVPVLRASMRSDSSELVRIQAA